jgi:hypothetical protein
LFLFLIFSDFVESTSSSSETNLTYVSQIDDNERPTAIESATHDIPPTDTASNNNETESTTENSETILPLISPSIDESSVRIIQTNEPLTPTIEGEQQSQEINNTVPQTTTNNNEYINPRGIRFTTSTTTPTTSGPVKGRLIIQLFYVKIHFLEPLMPYGWPCVRGLFRFLTTLINNYDKFV